jgi:hypothetical protein
VAKSLELGNEISGPVKKGGCIEQRSNIQVLKALPHGVNFSKTFPVRQMQSVKQKQLFFAAQWSWGRTLLGFGSRPCCSLSAHKPLNDSTAASDTIIFRRYRTKCLHWEEQTVVKWQVCKNLEVGIDDLFLVLRFYTQQQEMIILSQNCRQTD